MFVDQVLKFVSQRINTGDNAVFYIDMEVELKMFNEIIRPDYQVMRTEVNGEDTPLYAIEVKRTNIERNDLEASVDQHFKQLRHLCI
jgi:hypothetical protein